MFKINYTLKLSSKTTKFLSTTQLLLLLIFKNFFLNKKIKINFVKTKKKIKTLMLSPFHYKVAKKNLIHSSFFIDLTIDNIKINFNKSENLIFFEKTNNFFFKTNLFLFKLIFSFKK